MLDGTKRRFFMEKKLEEKHFGCDTAQLIIDTIRAGKVILPHEKMILSYHLNNDKCEECAKLYRAIPSSK
jgi:hypothetical protein